MRRNAALEERAAASIARAKAVVEGSDEAALKAHQTKADGRSAGVTESTAAAAERFAADAAAAAFDSPPTPPQEPAPPPAPHPPPAAAAAAHARPASRNSTGAAAGERVRATAPPPNNASRPASASSKSASAAASAPEGGGGEDDTVGRLAKARIRALQDELAAQGRELREAHSRLKDRDAELKLLLQDKLAGAKATKAMQTAVEKEKRAAAEARVSAEARERECAELRREMERAARGAKAGEQEVKARDVRLNRALEEVERYRHMLEVGTSK